MDAFDGTVIFYVVDTRDPLIRAWARAFPVLFTPFDKMPADLQAPRAVSRGSVQPAGEDVRHLSHAGPAGLLQQGRPVDHSRLTMEGRDREMEPYFTVMRLPGKAGGVRPALGLQPCPARQHDRHHGRAVRCAQLRRARRLHVPQAEAGVRAPPDRRPGRTRIPSSPRSSPCGTSKGHGCSGARCSPFPSRTR